MRHTLPCSYAPYSEEVSLMRVGEPACGCPKTEINPLGSEVRVTSDTGGQKGQKPAQFHRIPWDVMIELAEHYGRGAEKYPDPEPGVANWQLGYAWSLNMSALMRHLTAFWLGEDIDEETGSSHLSAVLWHAATLRWFQLHGKGTDDRPKDGRSKVDRVEMPDGTYQFDGRTWSPYGTYLCDGRECNGGTRHWHKPATPAA